MTLLSVLLRQGATIDALCKGLKHLRAILLLFFASVLAACATGGSQLPVQPVQMSANCAALFAAWDVARDEAGIHSPWGTASKAVSVLRGNRVLAAHAPNDLVGRQVWLTQALEVGMVAVRAEWAGLARTDKRGLPDDTPDRLWRCGQDLAEGLAREPAQFDVVRTALRPSDNYSQIARLLGAYPFAVPFMRLGIAEWQREARARLQSDRTPQVAEIYTVDPPPEGLLGALRSSAQLLPSLALPADEALLGWLAKHAPILKVAQQSAADQIGRVRTSSSGFVRVDGTQPTIYAQIGSAYLFGAPRLQLIYTVWFPERVAKHWLDPYAGKLDGLIWRVTLGADGNALAYDSIHPCGCFHSVFPAVPVAIADAGGREQPLIVQNASYPTGRLVQVGLTAGDHQLADVSSTASVPSSARQLSWQPITDLLALPVNGGPAVSLYRPDGLVSGTARAERFYLWPSGVPSAGAMRVWGQHATAFVGRAHFDDPYLLGSWLKPVIVP